MRTWIGLAVAALAGASFLSMSYARTAFGKEPKAEKEAVASLRWRRSYSAALREARLRNVPVFVSRHKDG